jgi:hypothetical protein
VLIGKVFTGGSPYMHCRIPRNLLLFFTMAGIILEINGQHLRRVHHRTGALVSRDRENVYIETSIVSYLTARPSSDLLAAAWQKVTIDWWDTQRQRFDLFVSGIVVEEARDSLHIAVSAVHGIDYLLTCNYRHIDNAETKPIIRKVCLANSYSYPEICTPRELMGVYENG